MKDSTAEYKQKYGKRWHFEWKRDQRDNSWLYQKGSHNRRKEHWRDYDLYKALVTQFTNEHKHLIPEIHTRGFRAYHIDHKISKRYGFDNGILAQVIAHHSNCEMIWWKDNAVKGALCKIDEHNKWIIDSTSTSV